MEKIVVVVLGFLLSSTGCYASTNLIKIMEDDTLVMLLDGDSVGKTNVKNVKRANIIVNNKKNKYSVVTSYEINCKTKQDRRVKLSDYEKMNAQGKLYGSQVINEPMEKADQRMVDIMCR